MAVGKLYTPLYLSLLPVGWKFEVTKLDTESYDDWLATFDNLNTPYTRSQGEIVNAATLTTTSVLNSGKGPSAKLHFEITTDKGVCKKGYIIFSSTDWGDIERPDYSLLTVAFDDEEAAPPINLSVSDLTDPGNYYIGFSEDDKGKIVIVAQSKDPITMEIMSEIVDGILKVASDTLSWVFGLLL